MIRSSTPLLLVTHGTRDESGAVASSRLAAEVRHRLPGVSVRLAFADVRPPTVAHVLPELLDTIGEVIVVPAFLATGYHVHTDLPTQLESIGAARWVQLTPALGPDPALVHASVQRLRAAGWRSGDAVVLGAAGSSDPDARDEVRRAARAVGRQLGTSVRVGYLTGGQPRLDDVVGELRADGRRVAVASWLLAPGFFQNRLLDCGAQVCAPPLAGHQGVVDAVLARYRRACRARTQVA
jgi:sirohydrochlorin ferrochelatase